MLIDFDLGGRVEASHLFVRLISELTLDEMTLISRFQASSFKIMTRGPSHTHGYLMCFPPSLLCHLV